MLDINFIRENRDLVTKACQDKNLDSSIIEQLISSDSQRKELLTQVEDCRAQSNKNAAAVKKQVQNKQQPDPELIVAGKEIKTQLKDLEAKFNAVDEVWQKIQLFIPNVPASDVPFGVDEDGNQVVKKQGTPKDFSFTPKHHADLMRDLDLLDTENAVRIGGFRSYFLKNEAVLLEQALLNYALRMMVRAGFTPLTAPVLVKPEALTGTGYSPWGDEDHYQTQDGDCLAGTAEVALTAFYGGQTLNEKDLPIQMVGISPCFRREVGTYGKDTQGIIRVHQFNKVEQVVYTVADEDITREWHQKMVDFSEKLLQDLELPYQVLLMCTGDMGAGQRKKYDIETWFPGQNKYRETHSASYFNDFQARRLNIRYRANDGTTKFVYTLNNTVAASPRLLAAILENYQQEDGSIKVPTVLQNLAGFSEIRR